MLSSALRERSKFHPETANVRVITSNGQGLEKTKQNKTKTKTENTQCFRGSTMEPQTLALAFADRSITFPRIVIDPGLPLGLRNVLAN